MPQAPPPTDGADQIPLEHLWWCEEDDRYFAWDGQLAPMPDVTAPDAAELGGPDALLALVSFDGARQMVAASRVAPLELSIESVAQRLLAAATGDLAAMTAALDPSPGALHALEEIAQNGTPADLMAAATRLVAGIRASPDRHLQLLGALDGPAVRLMRLVGFGSIARHLVEGADLGDRAPAPGLATAVEESPAARVARVRASVRKELDASAHHFSPWSLSFQDLVEQGPRKPPADAKKGP